MDRRRQRARHEFVRRGDRRLSLAEDRLVLTEDDDLFLELDLSDCSGILFQRDQSLSAREVGDIVDEMSRYIPQSEATLEYVSREWL